MDVFQLIFRNSYLVLLSFFIWLGTSCQILPRKQTLHVLIIGNSYTFNLAPSLKKIARSHHHHWNVKAISHGGWSLKQHSTHPETLQAIASQPWDFIIFQDHSLTPLKSASKRRIDSEIPLRALAQKAIQQRAQAMLFQTWSRRDHFDTMHPKIIIASHQAAKEAGNLPIIPIGQAWADLRQKQNIAYLYQTDGSHPSEQGTQLIAHIIFNHLTKHNSAL